MKKIITTFSIAPNKYIEIYFPDFENKFNYYYQPTQELHAFDEVMALYRSNTIAINIYKDAFGPALLNLFNVLTKAYDNLIRLPIDIDLGKMTYAFNESIQHAIYRDIDFNNFLLWSTPVGPETFMYTHNTILYLEIGDSYPWLFKNPEYENATYITYEKYMSTYKPIAVEIISPATAMQWLQQCEIILKQINYFILPKRRRL
ncbi:MAG: hypothetical protein WCE21_02630 [Candidatus Babeliales bacterium]